MGRCGSRRSSALRFAALVAAARDGRVSEARSHAEALLPLVLALFAEPSPGVLKGVLHAQGRIGTPDVRMPLGAASAAALERALAASASASLTVLPGH